MNRYPIAAAAELRRRGRCDATAGEVGWVLAVNNASGFVASIVS